MSNFNAFFSKTSSRRVHSEREKNVGIGLEAGREGAGAKDAPNRAENGGCPQGFWLGMSFAEDAIWGLKS